MIKTTVINNNNKLNSPVGLVGIHLLWSWFQSHCQPIKSIMYTCSYSIVIYYITFSRLPWKVYEIMKIMKNGFKTILK